MFTEAEFNAFSLSHGLAVVVVLLLASGLLFWVRKKPSSLNDKPLRISFAILLFYSAISGIVNAYLRHGNESFEHIHATEYPLFLCDVVAIVLGIAMLKKSQRLTEVGYAWGMAGTLQGLITPVMKYDFPSLEYFCFFIQHGGVPIAAILLIWGYGLHPQKGAYGRIWLWTWGYLFTTMTLNFILGTNYGFLNEKPPVPTAFDLLGDYPWYLLSLHGVAAVVYFLLLLPFKKKKTNR